MAAAAPTPRTARTARTARERARESVLADITTEARRQLAEVGPAQLSLRSVARELGMVSSAVYRYVASRDELLTLLLVDAYGRLATATERSAAGSAPDGSPGDDPRTRFLAACTAIRAWARRHPHEYALLYGSPVPGYAAPPDTIEPATRLYRTLLEPLAGARGPGPRVRRPLPEPVADDARRAAVGLGLDVASELMARGLGGLGTLFGLISLELFGHTHNVVTDHDAFFTDRTEALADDLGL